MRRFLTTSFLVYRSKVIHSHVAFQGDRKRAAKTVPYCVDGRTWPGMKLGFGFVESDLRCAELLAHRPAFTNVSTTTTTTTAITTTATTTRTTTTTTTITTTRTSTTTTTTATTTTAAADSTTATTTTTLGGGE